MINITGHILQPHMKTVQHLLLEDHTRYNPNHSDEYHLILWATNSYMNHQPFDEMTEHAYHEIQPSCIKAQENQGQTTKRKR